MNWILILTLSLVGLVMGVATLFGLGMLEPLLWLIIFIIYAWLIASRASEKYFLHGLLVSVFNGLWITAIHVTFFTTYVKNNPQMLQGTPSGINPRVMMIVMGPVVGALLGLVAGLFAFIASKIRKRPAIEQS
jgi:hypothetical protein